MQHAGDSYRDPHIRAVFAIAPAVAQRVYPESLHEIAIPVEIVAGAADPIAPRQKRAILRREHQSGQTHNLPGGVAHYTFLDVGTEAGKKQLPQLFVDNPGVDREAMHRQVANGRRILRPGTRAPEKETLIGCGPQENCGRSTGSVGKDQRAKGRFNQCPQRSQDVPGRPQEESLPRKCAGRGGERPPKRPRFPISRMLEKAATKQTLVHSSQPEQFRGLTNPGAGNLLTVNLYPPSFPCAHSDELDTVDLMVAGLKEVGKDRGALKSPAANI